MSETKLTRAAKDAIAAALDKCYNDMTQAANQMNTEIEGLRTGFVGLAGTAVQSARQAYVESSGRVNQALKKLDEGLNLTQNKLDQSDSELESSLGTVTSTFNSARLG